MQEELSLDHDLDPRILLGAPLSTGVAASLREADPRCAQRVGGRVLYGGDDDAGDVKRFFGRSEVHFSG